ncbi:MAG: carboxypeptidase regulatory-like domain-containing protein [Burkholderiales bacterium]|nr:carboxypeptidase regulatory-like domain-containing protein [Burkholderiales bacterium]
MKKQTMFKRQVGSTIALAALCLPAQAGVLQGQITGPAGKPVDGALITLTNQAGVSETVYSDKGGRYTLDTRLSGTLDLRVRKRYYRDHLDKVNLGSDGRELSARLDEITDPQELSDAHPSLSYFSKIQFDKDPKARFSRENFARDCLTCHQIGNSTTRMPRPPEGWIPSVQRMHGYVGNTDAEFIRVRAELLSKGLDGSLVTSKPVIPTDDLLKRAKIYEWRLDDSNVPHDAHIHHKNNNAYIVDMFAGKVIEVNLKTGKATHFAEPAQGMPPGGAFTKMGVPAPYGLTVPRAPHSLSEDSKGILYLTDSIGASIGVFDPVTKRFEHHDVGGNAVYPHTIRVDGNDVAWATMAFSNQVARFDPKSKDMKVFNLPATKVDGMACCQVPYGIDVSPTDGSVWYTKLFSDKIGRIDPVTFQITEYDSPVMGPRRHRFDRAGNLWIAGFSDGTIAKVDPKTWTPKIYKIPTFAPGEVPSPYSVSVNPKTQDIWVTDTMMDVAWRFIPSQEKFVAYPLPLKGTYTRDFSFSKEGWACTSNNPIPPTALEGGVPELICIDPGA